MDHHSWLHLFILYRDRTLLRTTIIPNDAFYMHGPFSRLNEELFSYLNIGLVIGGMIFGALHCVAWGFKFPSHVDNLLWKISAVICTAGPSIWNVSPIVFLAITDADTKREIVLWFQFSFCIFMSCVVVAYIFARVCLLVLVFRTLFYLPPEAFLSTWSSQVPHV
jgi:hypothetical protein